jgi:hypothetical protein
VSQGGAKSDRHNNTPPPHRWSHFKPPSRGQIRLSRPQADHIAATVASWLAELDAWSPFVELLGRAVRDGDWAAIHAIADYLSVEVQVAA